MRIIFIFLNTLFVSWSMFTFLFCLEFDFTSWVIVSFGSFFQIIVIIALIFKRTGLASLTIPFLSYHALRGFVLFKWVGHMVPSSTSPFKVTLGDIGKIIYEWLANLTLLQINNIVIVLTILYIVLVSLKKEKIKLIVGIIIGAILLVPFRIYQKQYLKKHPEIEKYSDVVTKTV